MKEMKRYLIVIKQTDSGPPSHLTFLAAFPLEKRAKKRNGICAKPSNSTSMVGGKKGIRYRNRTPLRPTLNFLLDLNYSEVIA